MRSLTLPCLLFFVIGSNAQFTHNPYADQTGQPFPLVLPLTCTNCTNYIGEYQIFLDDYRWHPDWQSYMKIEAVSFPFTPLPAVPDITVRKMVMPELESYGYNEESGVCQGWAWNSTNHGDLNAPVRDLMRSATLYFIGDGVGAGGHMSDECSLISSRWVEVSGSTHTCDDQALSRRFLPHTILKHTIYMVNANGVLMDSISWVYDHTRGRMRNYPFCWDCANVPATYDLVYRPYAIADPAPGGHTYAETENASWTGSIDLLYGTPNYFPAPYDLSGANSDLWPSNPTDPFITTAGTNTPARQAPYSLFEAPLLNNGATAYAGYYLDNDQHQQPFFNNDPAFDYPWTFTIDKPLDLHLINPNEKVIYNPSEVNIDIDGNLYPDKTLVFPSGYTFRTVHGVHPSEASVNAADPMHLYPDPAMAVPSTLGPDQSEYIVKAGNTLIIEPCVTIMDATIVLEQGAYLFIGSEVDGTFLIDDQPGSWILPLAPAPPDLPCVAYCFEEGWMDVKDVEVNGTETWSLGDIPADANSDDILRIGGTVRVKSGAVLEIESGVRLEFGPHGKFIVERGGHVEADEAVFTSACNAMWLGVEVWGTRDASQDPMGANADNGYLWVTNCSFLNAHMALLAGRKDDPAGGFNGGVIRAEYCEFRNNGLDVDVRATRNIHVVNGNEVEYRNRCQFLYDDFVTDGPLLDFAYNDGYGKPLAPEQHIRLVGTKGIIIADNAFSNPPSSSSPFLPENRGSGVYAMDAVFDCSNNTFSGLGEAIRHTFGGTQGFLPSGRFRINTIEDCLHGIVTVGTDYDEIVGNMITLPGSPQIGYGDTDPDQGYDYPVGIYTQESQNFHIEGNTITGIETNGAAQYKSYGMVINQSNKGVENQGTIIESANTSLIHMNTISGVNIGIQCEGANRGSKGWAGLRIECNEFVGASGHDHVYNHDIAVVGNWIDLDADIRGTLRNQGSCLFVETQAGNDFSDYGGSTDLEHLYFDDNTNDNDFLYSDNPGDLPSAAETNAPDVEGCLFGATRDCQPLLNCDKPCLEAKENQIKTLIQGLEAALSSATDSVEVSALEYQLDYAQAHLKINFNSRTRYVLEHEELDSLLQIFNSDEGIGKYRKLVYYHLEKGDLAAVDSLIQLIIDEEGLTSDPTVLLQFSAGIRSGQAISEGDVQMLKGMVEDDPLGAMSSKAILNHLKGEPYSRVPWMINDTRPGLRGSFQDRDREEEWIRLFPNPATSVLWVQSSTGMVSVKLYSIEGRAVWGTTPVSGNSCLVDVSHLSAGCFSVQVEFADGHVVHQMVIVQ